MPRMLLLLAEVIAFATLGIVASQHFGMAEGVKITCAYLVAYLIPRITLTKARGTSTTALVILFALTVLLIAMEYRKLTIWTLFDGYSLEMPKLRGDSYIFYKWALSQYDGRVECARRVVYPGFSYIMIGLWKLFGVSIVWPQAMNLSFTLSTMVLTGMTTRRLLTHRVQASPQSLIVGSMLLYCLLVYHINIGTCILKEASIYISMAMAGFALSAMAACDEERHRLGRDIVLFVAACLLTALVRTTYLYFIALGVVVMALPQWRRDWKQAAILMAVLAAALLAGNYFASYSFGRHAEIVGGGWNMQRFYVKSDTQYFYRELLNYYFLYSPWHKLFMLPLTMAVQFIIPMPWAYGYQNLLITISRMSYGWYFIGGTALFYYFYISWRRGQRLGAWPWWAAISFAVIAYIMAGSVARYVTPILPFFIPVAMFVLCSLKEGRWRKPFIVWAIVFVLLMTVALLLCLEIQQGTISSLLHTQSLVHYLKGLSY